MDGTPVYQPVGGPVSNGFTQAQSAPIGEHGPNEETLATPEAAQDCIPVEEQEITLTVPAIAQPGMKLQYRTPDGQELRLTVPEGVPPGSVLTLTQDPATKQWKCMAEPADEPPDFPYPSQAPQAPVAYPAQPSTLPMAQAYPAQGPPQRAVNLSFVPPPVPAQSYAATQMDPARFNPPRQDPMVFGMPDLMPQRHSYTPPPVSILERPSYTPMPQVLAGRPGSFQPPPVLSPSYVPPSNSWVPPVVLPYSQPGFGEVQPFPSQHAMPMWPPPDLLGLGGQLGHPGHPAPCPGFQREHFDPLLRTNFSQMSMQFPDYPPQMGPPQGMFQPQLGFNQGGMLGMHMHEVPLYGQKQPGMP